MYRLPLRLTLLPPLLSHPTTTAPPLLLSSITLNNPRASSTVADTTFWKQLIPKPLRKSEKSRPRKQHVKKKDWNPATFFLCIFLCIGSMSIQMIALRKDFEAFTRQSDARIGLLREVVEKLQNGEEVNVEKVLGTGDPEREKEWDEVLKEIEREEATRKKQQAEAAAAAQVKAAAEEAQKVAARTAPKSALSSQGFF